MTPLYKGKACDDQMGLCFLSCWFVCLSVCRIAYKIMDGFASHFYQRCVADQETRHEILRLIRIRISIWIVRSLTDCHVSFSFNHEMSLHEWSDFFLNRAYYWNTTKYCFQILIEIDWEISEKHAPQVNVSLFMINVSVFVALFGWSQIGDGLLLVCSLSPSAPIMWRSTASCCRRTAIALQSQKAVTAYLKSKQLPPLALHISILPGLLGCCLCYRIPYHWDVLLLPHTSTGCTLPFLYGMSGVSALVCGFPWIAQDPCCAVDYR